MEAADPIDEIFLVRRIASHFSSEILILRKDFQLVSDLSRRSLEATAEDSAEASDLTDKVFLVRWSATASQTVGP